LKRARAARHRTRRLLGLALARITGPRTRGAPLAAADIASVLVIRINGRLGNTLFMTPLIAALHALLPHASIDLALAYPQAPQLLGDAPGVDRVLPFPHKTPHVVWQYLAAVARMRRRRYDLAIDPDPYSTSDRLTLTLCRARYRLGFATEHQWAPLTHAVTLPATPLHQAVQPLYLLSAAFGRAFEPQGVRLALPATPAEQAAGREAMLAACGGPDHLARAVGFFAHATGAKQIAPQWWQSFWEAFLALQPEAVPVEFLPSPGTPPLQARFASLHLRELRVLACAMASARLLIATDSGPMHLGSATSVPTIGLFQASDPRFYGPLKPTDVAIEIAGCTPREVALHCQRAFAAARTA